MIDPEPQTPQPAPEPYPFWGYRDVLILIGLAFVLLIFVGTMARLLSTSQRVSAAQALAVTFAFEGLWIAMLYGVIRGGYSRPFWRSLGWVRPKAGFLKSVGAGLLAAACTIALGSLMPRPNVKMPMEELLRDRGSILLVGLFAITLGPLFEELAFRGFLMPLLMRTFGPVAGIALQAAPFAILHGAEYAWAWQQLILMFLAGAAFGWMRYKTGSTAASTYMHAGYNLVALTGIFAQSFVK
ncbi:MAG: lysostaphin resistance A-like protein [Acidobacteriota bacterium]